MKKIIILITLLTANKIYSQTFTVINWTGYNAHLMSVNYCSGSIGTTIVLPNGGVPPTITPYTGFLPSDGIVGVDFCSCGIFVNNGTPIGNQNPSSCTSGTYAAIGSIGTFPTVVYSWDDSDPNNIVITLQ